MVQTVTFVLYLGIIGLATALPSSLIARQISPPINGPSFSSCASLRNSCNANTVDLSNFYNYTSCFLLTACFQGTETPAEVLSASKAPATQPRLTESAFFSMSNGNPYMTQQNYIDSYYHEISTTPGGKYPDDVAIIIDQWETIAAWTGFCDTKNIPYQNLADWVEYSGTPGVYPSVLSCNPILARAPRVPQPPTDNGSCEEMVSQCRIWVTQGLFQNKYCVLASFCYAWSTTDVLLQNEYPPGTSPVPTTAQQERFSEELFHNMTGGAAVMTQQNVIDAYYAGLTGTWTSFGPFSSQTPVKTNNNGPYPTSAEYVIDFWSIISGWTNFCDTRAVPFRDLVNYLSYAGTSGYSRKC